MSKLTIFTPAFNRAHTIKRTYDSLLRQTCKDFEWLIVDDGSSDSTRELVESWISENKIPIRYIYQENQGMHGAHNTAYENITTELNVCVDSDDWMPDNAVEIILDLWAKNRDSSVAGIVGLDVDTQGKIIGTTFKTERTKLWDFVLSGGRGDKKLIYRTDVINKYPSYPLFENERYVSLATKYFMIDQDYSLITINKPLVIVDYQEDGSSYNMYQNYMKNPQGFIYDRKLVLSTKQPLKVLAKYCIHYTANKCIAKEYSTIISDSPRKFLTFLTLPLGILWYFTILRRYKRGVKINMKK